MKKNILIIAAFILTSGSIFLSGCSKDEDTTAPVVTLNGSSSVTVTLNGTYTEQGATASDAEDGTVTVTTSGTVDVNTAGTYTITYTASDGAGNTGSATRTVTVVITRANYVWGGFNAADSSTTNATIGAFAWSGITTAGGAADAIIISNFSGSGQSAVATVSGATVTIASQTVGALTNVTGNGTMNSTGTQITINYSATFGTTDSFHAVLTKL